MYPHIDVLDISRQRVVFFRDLTTSGLTRIVLNIVLVFNTVLLRLVATRTTMETSLEATGRLKIVEETTISEYKPGEVSCRIWPCQGSVEFHNVTAS
jgi:hypothetical protein